MRSPPKPVVFTYAQLRGSIAALFANNKAMGAGIKRAIKLRDTGNFNAAKDVEDQLTLNVTKDRQLMAKVTRALNALHHALRPIILPATRRKRPRAGAASASSTRPPRRHETRLTAQAAQGAQLHHV